MKYTFVFDKMTIGDYCALVEAANTCDTLKFLTIIAKCMPDVYGLPMLQLNPLIEQFAQAFKAYTDQTPQASRLLRQALGEEGESI